jgi:Ca2+/Na+ antiporter
MKRTGKIHSILLTDAELKKCKKQKEYVGYVNPRLLIFAIVMFLDGVFGIVCEMMEVNRYLEMVYMLIFFAAFLWFTDSLRKARDKFC